VDGFTQVYGNDQNKRPKTKKNGKAGYTYISKLHRDKETLLLTRNSDGSIRVFKGWGNVDSSA
jgi:hypothetical protein